MRTALIILAIQAAVIGAFAAGFVLGRAFERLDKLRQATAAFSGLANMMATRGEDDTASQSEHLPQSG